MKPRIEWRHKLTGVFRTIIGARVTSAGTRVFVTTEAGNLQEKLFLADSAHWDVHPDELESIFIQLLALESKRVKNKKAKLTAAEKKEEARIRREERNAEISDEDRDNWDDRPLHKPVSELLEEVPV